MVMATENEIVFNNPPRIGFCWYFQHFFFVCASVCVCPRCTQPGSFFLVLFRNGVYWCVFRMGERYRMNSGNNRQQQHINKIQHCSARISHFMLSLAVWTYFYAFKLCTYLFILFFFFGNAGLPNTVLPVLRFYTHIVVHTYTHNFFPSLLSICVCVWVCVECTAYSNIYSWSSSSLP